MKRFGTISACCYERIVLCRRISCSFLFAVEFAAGHRLEKYTKISSKVSYVFALLEILSQCIKLEHF